MLGDMYILIFTQHIKTGPVGFHSFVQIIPAKTEILLLASDW